MIQHSELISMLNFPQSPSGTDSTAWVFFPEITLTAPGTYTYTLRETSSSGNGWTTDNTTYRAVVTVTEDGTGNLVLAGVDYPDGLPVFTNIYEEKKPVPVTIRASKSVTGATLSADAFSFGLFDAGNQQQAVAVNDASGQIAFPAIFFDQPGLYQYTLRELNASGYGWTNDTTIYPVLINITAESGGKLTAVISYPEGEPHFVNKYEPSEPPCLCCQSPVELSLQARKTARGACLKENMFSFAVETPGGEILVTAKNGKDGLVRFPKICLNRCGTYRYVIRELACGGDGWTRDSRIYRVNVTVTEDRNGKLTARVQYPDGKPQFVNRFSCGRRRGWRV